MLGHLLFEHLLQDGLYALAHSGLDIHLDFMLELVFRGQASPFSLETHKLPDTISTTSVNRTPKGWCTR
jgi:hypothetical protein